MTETLAQKKCTPCRGGVPRLTLAEAEHFRSQTPNWELRDNGYRIERTFHFSNFRAALGFVRGIGNLAETEAHHLDVSFGHRWKVPNSFRARYPLYSRKRTFLNRFVWKDPAEAYPL